MVEIGQQKDNDKYTEVKGVYFLDGRDAASGAAQGFPTNAAQASPNAAQLAPAASPMAPATGFPSSPQPFAGQPPQFQPGPVAGKAPWER